MPRIPHAVTRIGPGENPDVIVTVQAGASRAFLGDADEVGYHALSKWAACLLCWRQGALDLPHAWADFSTLVWWDSLKRQTVAARRVWVFSAFAREQMALLGLWDLMLRGQATPAGEDPRAPRAGATEPPAPRPGVVILEGPPTIVTFRLTGCDTSFTWLDVRNYGANASGLTTSADPPPAGPADLWGNEPWTRPDDVAAQAGAVALWVQSYTVLLARLNLGALEHTAATQAMSGYRRRYYRGEVVTHDNPRVLAMERAALFGGRCEARYLGTLAQGSPPAPGATEVVQGTRYRDSGGPVWHLDFNSLYPSVAADACLPVELNTVARWVDVRAALEAARCVPVIAECRVRTDVPCVPVRLGPRLSGWPEGDVDPLRAAVRRDGALTVYPVGECQTTLCGPELLLAARLGAVVGVQTLALYSGRQLYRWWVDRLYNERQSLKRDGYVVQSDAVKALLNSSFGKWAQHRRRWEDMPDELCHHPYYQWWQAPEGGGAPEQWRSFGWRVQRLVDAGEPNDSFPALTAFVNSLGRVRLWEAIACAGPDHVYYYDTDSIWTDDTGVRTLDQAGWLHATDLGKLKTVARHETVEFLGVKRYIADGCVTCAGAANVARREDDPFALSVQAPPVGYYLHHKHPPGLDRIVARVRLAPPYVLGRVAPDGSVHPWKLFD